jgi:hypothetical protein
MTRYDSLRELLAPHKYKALSQTKNPGFTLSLIVTTIRQIAAPLVVMATTVKWIVRSMVVAVTTVKETVMSIVIRVITVEQTVFPVLIVSENQYMDCTVQK